MSLFRSAKSALKPSPQWKSFCYYRNYEIDWKVINPFKKHQI